MRGMRGKRRERGGLEVRDAEDMENVSKRLHRPRGQQTVRHVQLYDTKATPNVHVLPCESLS